MTYCFYCFIWFLTTSLVSRPASSICVVVTILVLTLVHRCLSLLGSWSRWSNIDVGRWTVQPWFLFASIYTSSIFVLFSLFLFVVSLWYMPLPFNSFHVYYKGWSSCMIIPFGTIALQVVWQRQVLPQNKFQTLAMSPNTVRFGIVSSMSECNVHMYEHPWNQIYVYENKKDASVGMWLKQFGLAMIFDRATNIRGTLRVRW